MTTVGGPATTSALSDFARDVHSQGGEDGILERIFELLGVTHGWCVEFGAWDGIHLSNTRHLIESAGWNGVLIEADASKFVELEANVREFPGITCKRAFVNFDPPDDLDTILAQTETPTEFDLLSIDVDGNDFHIWKAVTRYRPKVVVVEINPTIPNHIEFVQARDMSVQQGSSARSLVQLGQEKGYELVATTQCNVIFVRNDLFAALGIVDNSLDALRTGHDDETSILHLFDGTLVLAGRTTHPWNGIELRNERIQVLPRPLRTYTPEASDRVRKFQRYWAWLYRTRP
jgi:hypothetical protein